MTPANSYPYAVVDVFTTEPLSGNSLAVFPDASEFDTEMMQKIARELNRTETAFVHPASRRTARLACAYLPNERNALSGPSHRWHGLCVFAKRNRFERLPRDPSAVAQREPSRTAVVTDSEAPCS